MESLPNLDIVANGHTFFKPTDTFVVANSPRVGVGLGFEFPGLCNFLSQMLLSQLIMNPLGLPGEVIRPKLQHHCHSIYFRERKLILHCCGVFVVITETVG